MNKEPAIARLTRRDFDACSAALFRLYEEMPFSEFPQRLPAALSEIVRVEHVSYNDFDVVQKQYQIHTHPLRPELGGLLPVFTACFPTHPLIKEYEAAVTAPTKVSDVATTRQFQETAIYQEVYRRLGTRYQMIFFFHRNRTRRIGLAFNRAHRDFSERDRSVLAFLSPHISRAYNNRRIANELPNGLEQVGEGLATMRRAVILADALGNISWLNEPAREWLREFFPDYDATAGVLPPNLKHQLLQCEKQTATGLPVYSECNPAAGAAARLQIYSARNPDGSLVIALVREAMVIDSKALSALKLTESEGQILFWISEAKTSPEIASILGISQRTIHKHSENIFAKLGLENRLEAQRLGLELRKI